MFFFFLQETLAEVVPRLSIVKDKLFKSQEEFSKLCDAMYLEQLKRKIANVVARLEDTEKRLRVGQTSEVSFRGFWDIASETFLE